VSAADPRVARGMAAQLRERARLLEAGERPLGWKVGFGTPAVMEQLGISAALVGYLLYGARLESGAEVSLADWRAPILEPEIAVHLNADLPGRADRATVRAAVAGLSAAIELANLDPPPGDVEAMLAGDLYQRAVLLGPLRDVTDATGVRAVVSRNGEEEGGTDDPTAATGDLLDVVAHVAKTLEDAGERLRAGEVIITGSVIPALPVRAGDEIEVALEPLGTLTVRFTT
jgi:2-keto-4-pentenoate hydratase